jgi:hypothetical protein
MFFLILLPFFLQTAIIFFDEFHFHWKRGLPKWERIGHPLDTLSTLVCFAFVLFYPFNNFNLKIYCALAIFSCIFVTKDEFVHKECCPAAEQWLHALLFLNHPIVLILLGVLWSPTFAQHATAIQTFLWVQTVCVALFALYQTVYWNFLRKCHETD